MRYKDLKEMNVKDWDGKPFYAIGIDEADQPIWLCDLDKIDGIEYGYLIRGFRDGKWIDDDDYEWLHAYPIKWNNKPKKRMTYRQLSKWLAKGNGVLWKSECNHVEFTSHNYITKYADNEVMDDWKVRKWDSEEWIEPTTDLLEDC